MDLIYERTRENGAVDSGYLCRFSADFDITTNTENPTNDFEITMKLPKSPNDLYWTENGISTIVYVEGTEFGGEIKGADINIRDNTITYTGRTWRGTLSQYIIEPPSGQDYLIVSGNLADSLRLLPMNPIIDVQNTEYSGNSYQFDRYIPTFEGIDGLLTAAQENLRTILVYDDGSVKLSIVEARDLTNLIEISQDYNDKVSLSIKRDHNTPKHLICLGRGELHDRQVVHLYADENWNVSTTPIAGAYPVDTYDYSSSDALEADGRKQYAKLIADHEQIDVSIDNLDIQLSDIIAAKDFLTGETVTAEITSIVWKCINNGRYQTEDFEYRTKVRK